MSTPVEDSMQLFDLDLLLDSAPTSTFDNIIEDVYVNQNFNLLESTEQVCVQNESKAEHLNISRCFEEGNKDYEQMQRCLEEKSKDYDQLKQQFIKLGQDFADLHYESKKNALDAINANSKFEKITEELKISQHKMIAFENKCSVSNTLHKAALSNNNQLTKLIEQLESEAANLRKTSQSYKEAIKEEKRNNSTITLKLKTYEEDLCSIAGKLDRATVKKNRDRETQRQISKYTKNKLNSDLENDSESVDTGRGSSSCSSYSPAYSINFSPMNMIESFEQKMTKDASTNTETMNERFDLSKHLITSTSFEVGTERLENKSVNVDSSNENIKTNNIEEKITTVDTASSPIFFVDDIEEKITKVDTASSPISFVDVIEKKITTVDTASSPISFVDDIEETITTVDTASSSISFVDDSSQDMAKIKLSAFSSFSSIKSPAARSKMKHLDCSPKAIDIVISPIYVDNPTSPEPMTTSKKSTGKPIEFASLKSADMTIPAIEITDISRPLESTAVTSPVAQTTDITRPCKPAAVTSPVVQTPEITSPCKPATVTSPVVQTPEITSPCKPAAVTSQVVQTPEITRPCKPAAVTSSLVQTTEITRPQKQNAVRSPVVQTPHITRSFKPAAVTSPVVQTPQKTRPLKLNAVINPVVQTPEITRPFKPATMSSLVVQTPEITRPLKPNAVSNSVVQTPELTRPLQSANVVERSTVKTPDMSMQLKPTAVTKHADLLTKPNGTNDVKRQSHTSQISEMAGHIESTGFVNHESKTTTSEHVISLVNNNISVITKTPHMTHPINAANVRKSVIQSPTRHMKHADARRPIINTKPLEETKQNESIKIFSSEKSLCKSFEEIQSHIAQDNNQERDDLEVRMILNSFRLDWNALSPMSITPTLDEEGLVQTKSDVRNYDTLRQFLEHPRSEISNESDALLLITPDYKKLTITQNKSDMTIYMPQSDKTMHPNAVSNSVVQTPELTRPLQSANVVKRSTVKTSDMSMQLKPTAADLLSNPNDTNDVKRQSITSQISEMAGLVQSKSDVRNHDTLRQSSEHCRSEISNESDSLLVITPDYKKLTIPQNKSDKTMHLTKRKADGEIYHKITKIHEKIEMSQSLSELTSNSSSLESQSLQCIFRCSESNSQSHTSSKQLSESLESNKKDHLLKETKIDVIVSKPPERRRSERIKSGITVALCKTKNVPQTTQLESSPIDNMSRLKESQSNMSVLKELQFNTRKKPDRRSERIKSTIPAAETNTPKQPERRRSERIKSIIPPVQSNTRKPRERRRSERINSTFPPAHSNTCKPPEKRRSERIKSTIPPAQSNKPYRRKPAERRLSERIKFAIAAELSKTNSEPQTQTKLHSSPIDNMTSLKELQFNPRERRISDKINSKIPPAESKTDSVPQNQTKLQASLIDDIPMELGSNTRKPAETCMSDRIKSTIPPAESKTISVPQNQPKLQSRTINDMSMSKELESNTRKPAETCMSDRIKSTIPPAESKTNSVPQTQMELQSSPIDNMTSSKDLQCNMRKQRERRISDRIKSTFPPAETKTYSVPQTQTKLRSTPIDNMTSLKDLQSNMRKPAETCISDRIKSTNPPAESKTNSVPQNQTTLQASPIDITSISKETETNTRSGYPPIVSNPENGRKRTICRSMEAQSDNKHSKHQNKSECDTNKLNPAEIFSEDKFTYSHSKKPKKRISRVKASVSIDDMSMELESNTHKPAKTCMSDRVKSTIPPAESKTNSVPQTQMKLQSSPIDNMTSSKDLQCNTRKQRQGRLSGRINSTMPPAESKTNRVPQTQTKLQASPIDIMSISRETETNTRSGCPPILSNPENGRKRTICRSMETQSNNIHSKHQNKSECDTNKLIPAEIYSEDKFTYSHSKEPKKRISRMKASAANTKSVLNNNQSENIGDRKSTETINKELSYTPAFKRAKLADDTTGFLVKPGQDMNKNDCTKMTITDASTQAKNNNQEANPKTVSNAVTTYKDNHLLAVSEKEPSHKKEERYCADYNDIDIFNTDNNNLKTHTNKMNESSQFVMAHNLLDKMIFKYGSNRKWTNRPSNIISKDKYADRIAQEIESAVATCVKVSVDPNKYHETLQKAVRQLQKHSDISKFTIGFFKYLKNNDRKAEFLPANKNRNYSLKPIPTKYVVSLMQIIDCIGKNGLDLWEPVLNTCRYMLFNLDKNSTASLDVVESVTHLFVNMCQFKGRRNAKLIFLFMLTAMYCANYRAIIIIKHCLELVPEILPHECQKEKILNNMQPLFRTFIFLLHFYNCNDQFQKVHSVRLTLKNRYSYNPTQENDTTILFMLKQSILKINDCHLDIILLEYSILILAKRRGTKWCHTNIVQKILLPIIQGEIYASKDAFRFCLTIITKLLKPYNHEMSGHSVGVANMLMNIVEKPHHQDVKDDIICGLLYINVKSVSERVNTFLANWNPPSISPKLEEALKQYIQKKPVKHWMSVHETIQLTPIAQQIIGS